MKVSIRVFELILESIQVNKSSCSGLVVKFKRITIYILKTSISARLVSQSVTAKTLVSVMHAVNFAIMNSTSILLTIIFTVVRILMQRESVYGTIYSN